MSYQPGWYPDPAGNTGMLRWWDGVQWTQHVAPAAPTTVPTASVAVAQQQPTTTSTPQEKSALGITGFVLGIIALATSFIPIVNNVSALIALVGLPFAIIGTIACVKRRKSGKGLSIAGLIICVVAFILVLVTQMIFIAALDEASKKIESSSFQSVSSSASSFASASNGQSDIVTSSQPA